MVEDAPRVTAAVVVAVSGPTKVNAVVEKTLGRVWLGEVGRVGVSV